MKKMKLKSIKFEIKMTKLLIKRISIPKLCMTIIRTEGEYNFLSPLKRIIYKMNILYNRIKFKLKEIKPLACQDCDEGIALTKIKDPNDRRKRLLCCDKCHNFYN